MRRGTWLANNSTMVMGAKTVDFSRVFGPEGLKTFRAPPKLSKFSGSKNEGKSTFLAPVTIVELFASHVPRRMQILSSGDGLEGHFQSVFANF